MTDPRVSRRAPRPSTILWRDLLPFAFGALTMAATSADARDADDRCRPSPPLGGVRTGGRHSRGRLRGQRLLPGRRHRRTPPAACSRPRSCAPPASPSMPPCACCRFRVGPPPREPPDPCSALTLAQSTQSRSIPSGLHRAAVTGLLAYPLTILAGLGFAVGTAAVTSLLDAPIHCHRCRK